MECILCGRGWTLPRSLRIASPCILWCRLALSHRRFHSSMSTYHAQSEETKFQQQTNSFLRTNRQKEQKFRCDGYFKRTKMGPSVLYGFFFLVGFWPFWGLLLLAIATFIPSAAEWIQIVVLRIYMWPSTSLVIFIIIWCCVCVVSLLLLSRSIFLFTSPSFCFVFFCFVQPLIKMMTGTWLPEMPAGHGSLISHDRHHHTYVTNYSRSSTKQSDSSFDYPIHLGQHQLEKMCPLNVRK